MSKFNELVAKLREIFQIDRPELDFGIYRINPADNEYDVVYLNGDHNIPTKLTQTTAEGGASRELKLQQIEPKFLERMFSVEDV